jgi:beta-glucosidase
VRIAAIGRGTARDKTDGLGRAGNLSEAVSVAQRADAVVLVLGLSAEIEGEQGDASNSEAAGDKVDISLTGLQQRMLEQVTQLGKPTVLVLMAGSAMNLTWAEQNVGAIVDVWYPGETGGTALADVLFGDYCPAGRLPITFPRSMDDVPTFTSYAMKGRTYRYLQKEPLYPFGYGLSYTEFEYSQATLSSNRIAVGDAATLTVTVKNVGPLAGDEVVQLYIKDEEASVDVPHHSLKGFERLRLEPGQSQKVTFEVTPKALSLIDEAGRRVLEPGRFRLSVGGSQPDPRSVRLLGRAPLSLELEVTGSRTELPY